jgi:HK97 family phage major capsid protein
MNLKQAYDAVNKTAARVQQIAAQINTLFDEDKIEDAKLLQPQLEQAKSEHQEANQQYLLLASANTEQNGDNARHFVPTQSNREPKEIQELRASREYKAAFWDAFKNGVTPKSIRAGQHSAEKYGILLNALTETGDSGDEGGNLLPVEFDNMIKELMRTYSDLAQSQWFNIEEVTAYSGWRAVEQAGPALPFAAHTENQSLANAEEPEWSKVTYTIVEYGGYIPIVTNLLNDTPAQIMAYLSRWFAKKAALTNTSIIATLLKAVSDTNITDYKLAFQGLKTMLNKTLDPAISAGASIFMNQTGLDFFDQLEDGNARPLLQPDPSQETEYRIKGRSVVVLPDALFANTDTNTKTQVAIGDGRQWLTFFRRMPFEMASTNIGGDAWRYNNTEVRGVMRADAKVMDASAMGLLHITLPT